MNNLTLKDIDLSYRDRQLEKAFRFRLEGVQGSMANGEPVTLEILGQVQDETFELALDGGSLAALHDPDADWPLQLRGELAGTPIEGEGVLVHGQDPLVRASLKLGKVDLGTLLARLGVVDGLEVAMARVEGGRYFCVSNGGPPIGQ